VPDVTLLEAARREALEKDTEWYQSIIGGSVTPAPAAGMVAGPPSIEDGTADNSLPLRPLVELGYSRQEAVQLPEDIAGIIVEDQITRPVGALPREWLAVDVDADVAVTVGEDMDFKLAQKGSSSAKGREKKILQQRFSRYAPPPSRPSTPSSKRAQRKRDATQYKKVYEQEALMDDDLGWGDEVEEEDNEDEEDEEDEMEREYRKGLRANVYRQEGVSDYEDFGPTFPEQEPGLLPLLVDKVAERVRDSALLRPLLTERTFTSLLSQEADLRLLVTGPWAAELMQNEFRWRLGLFRDYLKVEKKKPEAGLGDGRRTTKKGGWKGWGYEDEVEEENGEVVSSFLEGEEEEEEGDDDFFFDKAAKAWRRRRRSGPTRQGGGEGRRRMGGDTDPYFYTSRSSSGSRSSSSNSRSSGSRPSIVEWVGMEEEEEEEGDDVMDASWSAFDEDEDEQSYTRRATSPSSSRRSSSPSSSPSVNRRRRRERKQEVRAGVGVDRRFMGQQEEEATNDRSGAWVWQNPSRTTGGGREGGGGGGGGGEKGRRERGQADHARMRDGGRVEEGRVFRWPWEMAGDDFED